LLLAHLQKTYRLRAYSPFRCGHSTGLLVVAAVFLALQGQLDLEAVGSHAEWLVGVVLIALGIYTMYMAVFRPEAASASVKVAGEATPLTRFSPVASRPAAGKPCRAASGDEPLERETDLERPASGPRSTSSLVVSEKALEEGENPLSESAERLKDYRKRGIAFVVGIVHGTAGPGGVLGVLPAVQMRSLAKAGLHLMTFCVTSILVMGVVASSYGELTRWAGRDSDSGSLSLAVGIVWIVLSALGILDDVFG
jgi:hypothetical protein